MTSKKECIIRKEKVTDISEIIPHILRFENTADFYFTEELVRYIAEDDAAFAQWTNDGGKKTYSVRRNLNSQFVVHIQLVLVYSEVFQTYCYKMISTSIRSQTGITKLIRNSMETESYFLFDLH